MLFRRLRRVAVGAGVGLGVIALSTSSAYAFECYNAVRSAAGNQAAGANSQALVSFERILADPEIVGLCPEGVDFTIAAVEDAGYRTDILINFHTLMAGGLVRAGHEDQLHDGKGIDHLGEEFTIRFAIWDTGDQYFDSTVLVDGFEWIANGGTVAVGTDPIDDPK